MDKYLQTISKVLSNQFKTIKQYQAQDLVDLIEVLDQIPRNVFLNSLEIEALAIQIEYILVKSYFTREKFLILLRKWIKICELYDEFETASALQKIIDLIE